MDAIIELKIWLTEWSGLARDALHIYVGLFVFLLACIRWQAWKWQPWILVFIVAAAGEAIDIQETIKIEGRTYLWGNWHDLWNTMILPTILMLVARYTRLLEPRGNHATDENDLGNQP